MFKYILYFLISSMTLASACKKGYLCGSGCGLHEAEADGAARAQIGKMFKVKVTSSFTSARAEFGELDESYVHEVIDEYIEENLEGITIENRVEDGDEICATAVLNKINFSVNIKNKMMALNKESKELKASGNRLAWEKIRVNNSKLSQLGSIFSGVEVDSVSNVIPVPVLKSKPITINVENTGDSPLFKNLIVSRILRNGYKKGKSDKLINIKLDLKKIPLNISGFEKYELTVDLKTFKGKKEVAKSYARIVKTGRNKEQVIDKIFTDFKDALPSYFVDLKI
ncbi:MAG: hypothetical protein VX341_04920 [Bdellovibrionota bacterium]|nr:hypothetical protein [Bdellovibrionota bacterium]